MIKRIVSVLLIAAMALGTTGCGGEKSGNTEEPQTTTEGETTATSAVATTPEETAPVETTTDIVDYLIGLGNFDKPVTATTTAPSETEKPDGESLLGDFTGEPAVDWDGKKLCIEIERVFGATEYRLSIDSEKFTDTGDLCNEKKPLPTTPQRSGQIQPLTDS